MKQEKYLEQTLQREIKHTFYAQYFKSYSLSDDTAKGNDCAHIPKLVYIHQSAVVF
jgi:hypothetical protein